MNIQQIISDAEKQLRNQFDQIDQIQEKRTRDILNIFRKYEVSYRHFNPTTGYGYDDVGRDTLEKIYADLFGTEQAIVRPHIASGTHVLSLCLFGLTRSGERILSATGMPYDTLHGILGINENPPAGSLRDLGVSFDAVPLTEEGKIDVEAVDRAIDDKTTLVIAQRSRGYDWRPSLLPESFKALADMIHTKHPGVLLMVDNCYGEFVCDLEPTHYGVDVCAGSLIKNPGGGLAPTGGYVAGSSYAIERISARLTAPGIGREVGSYAGSYQPFYQGLFMAPHTVAQALKTAVLAASLFEKLGLSASPASGDTRGDIIQAIRMEKPERLIAFCQGIQSVSPVDSMALPEPWDIPGYDDPVIMAAGTFVSGASVELSADAPMRDPYIIYMQGALTYSHGRIALIEVLERMDREGII